MEEIEYFTLKRTPKKNCRFVLIVPFFYGFIYFIRDALFVTTCFRSDNYLRSNTIPASKM